MKPIKVNKYLLAKVGGLALSVGATILTGIATKNENAKILEKLVDEKLKSK